MDKKLKIAFFNFTQGTVQRGAEVFVQELSSRLKKNHQVDVLSDPAKLTGRWPFIWRFYIDAQGVQILLFTLKNLAKVFKEKYDVIIPLNGGWQSVLLRFTTLLYGGKMVISGQSGKGWDDKNNLWIFPDAFVALSSSLKAWAKLLNPFIKVKYIPNGVDLNKFKPDGQKKSFDLEGPVVLCVGALTEEKRINLAIEAVAKMGKASLIVLGIGPLNEKLLRQGEKALGKRFLITHAKHENLPEYYRGADIFTVPSPGFRSFEIVLVEAMATNLPVVANNDRIRKEIVGEGGILVNPANISDYAKALEKAIDTKWGNKPRKQAEKFSWDEIAKKYEELFKELIK